MVRILPILVDSADRPGVPLATGREGERHVAGPAITRPRIVGALASFLAGAAVLGPGNVTDASSLPGGAVLRVGPAETYKRPSQAAAAAHDGDVIQIRAGTYKGDVAVWRANNLTITGVDPTGAGARATMDATGLAIPNRKGIWVIDGNNTTIENIEFTGAHDAEGRDRNWAGIRQEGSSLTVVHCSFHHNDDGILGGAGAASDIVVKTSEFAANGFGDGQSHNMYIGAARSFTLEFSSSHDARVGHLVKSRARANSILYNRLSDGPDGTASYELDLPNGGLSYVIGNVIEQGPKSQNSGVMIYAEEGAANAPQALYVVNNTFVNDLGRGTFVSVHGAPAEVRVINNIFAGRGRVFTGPGTLTTNLASNDPKFVNRDGGDYHLASDSPAIDAGTDPGAAGEFALAPRFQYTNLSGVARPQHGRIDIGAYEY
jgi:hypothetical protein